MLLPALVIAGAVSVFIGTQYSGQGLAVQSAVYWPFWDGGYVHATPDEKSCTGQWYCPAVGDGYANGGISHWVSKQVNCYNFPDSMVFDDGGRYFNYWWGYLPYKNGWVNEVHFQGGANNSPSIGTSTIVSWNIYGTNNRDGAAAQGCGYNEQ
jgi:hypothetical protein